MPGAIWSRNSNAWLPLLFIATAAYAQIRLDLPAQSLSQSLTAVGSLGHLNVMFDPSIVDGLQAPALKADMTADDALSMLLVGTKLHAVRVDANTVRVVAKGVSQHTSRTTTPNASSGDYIPTTVRVADAAGKTPALDSESSALGASGTVREDENATTAQLEQIVVTGTYIRGVEDITSPIIQIDRDTIDRSGYQNTGEYLQSLPEAFAGGAQGGSADGNLGPGTNAGNNNEHATAINLRGLGENATLTLLNGHRMAPSAFGNVVDASTIPLPAVDHIDVLTDGASAIYGADAVAGVVNIVLRKDYEGADSRVSYGGVNSGTLRQSIFDQTFGDTWDKGSLIGSLEYGHESALPTSDRVFTADVPQPTNIINPVTNKSIVLNGDQRIGESLTVSGDALATWRNTSSIATRAIGSTISSFSDPRSINLNLSGGYALSASWLVNLTGTYGSQKTDVGFEAYPQPLPLGSYVNHYAALTRSLNLKVNGTIASLPGGDLKVAVGAEHRKESASVRQDVASLGNGGYVRRGITAEFAELYIPLIGETNALPLFRKVVISAALRHDNYSDFGTTTNPKFGLLWNPVSWVGFRVNWSKAFRPPSLGELVSAANGRFVFNFPFDDPAGNGFDPVLVAQGNNPQLGPETSKNLNAGVELSPSWAPGLKLSASYYDVDFRNRIIAAPFDTSALLHPDVYGSLITPLANDAAAAALLNSLIAQGAAYVDFLGTGTSGVRYFYNAQLLNAAVVKQNGFDLTTLYTLAIGANELRTGINVAFINNIDTQFSPNATSTSLVNTYSSPLRWRSRWDATWSRGSWSLTGALNESSRYTDTTVVPAVAIGSWTTVDISAAFTMPRAESLSILHGLSIRVSALNIFGRLPPYTAAAGAGITGVHYDVGNASPLGRFVSLELRKQW